MIAGKLSRAVWERVGGSGLGPPLSSYCPATGGSRPCSRWVPGKRRGSAGAGPPGFGAVLSVPLADWAVSFLLLTPAGVLSPRNYRAAGAGSDGLRSRSSEYPLYILRMKKRFPHLTLMRVGSSGKLDSVWRSSDLSLIYKGGKRKTRARARGASLRRWVRGADLLWMVCAGAEMVSDQARLEVVCGLSPEVLCGPFLAPGR